MFGQTRHESVKREAGANPARSRRCERIVHARCHWETGKVARAMTLEPEDLPVLSHQSTLRAIGGVY